MTKQLRNSEQYYHRLTHKIHVICPRLNSLRDPWMTSKFLKTAGEDRLMICWLPLQFCLSMNSWMTPMLNGQGQSSLELTNLRYLILCRHLSGVKTLLEEANVNVLPQGHKPSRAQVATFWNFARCYYLAAYINHTTTRIDTKHVAKWQKAGLLIDKD